jgi:hypothetical protein
MRCVPLSQAGTPGGHDGDKHAPSRATTEARTAPSSTVLSRCSGTVDVQLAFALRHAAFVSRYLQIGVPLSLISWTGEVPHTSLAAGPSLLSYSTPSPLCIALQLRLSIAQFKPRTAHVQTFLRLHLLETSWLGCSIPSVVSQPGFHRGAARQRHGARLGNCGLGLTT